MDNIMREIAEKMAEEGRPMIKLAELFIKEPLSLESLFMIADNDPTTVEHISNEIMDNVGMDMLKMTDILDNLKGFDVIDVKDNIVNITDRGQCIIVKLRKKMNSLDKNGENLCDMKHDHVYKVGNY